MSRKLTSIPGWDNKKRTDSWFPLSEAWINAVLFLCLMKRCKLFEIWTSLKGIFEFYERKGYLISWELILHFPDSRSFWIDSIFPCLDSRRKDCIGSKSIDGEARVDAFMDVEKGPENLEGGLKAFGWLLNWKGDLLKLLGCWGNGERFIVWYWNSSFNVYIVVLIQKTIEW